MQNIPHFCTGCNWHVLVGCYCPQSSYLAHTRDPSKNCQHDGNGGLASNILSSSMTKVVVSARPFPFLDLWAYWHVGRPRPCPLIAASENSGSKDGTVCRWAQCSQEPALADHVLSLKEFDISVFDVDCKREKDNGRGGRVTGFLVHSR